MFSKKRLFKIYIFPFIVILVFMLVEYVQTEFNKHKSFEEAASDTSALSEVDQRIMVEGKVSEVVDGDTIRLETGETVRYIGVDTPETKHPNKPVQCFGREASTKNKELVEGKTILMERDISETDRYGRLLRYIYLPNPEASDEAIFVNEYLVEQGYAHLLTYPPDVKYDKILRDAETLAKNENRGLWGRCN